MKKYINFLFLFYLTFFVGWNGKTIRENDKYLHILQPAIGFDKSILQIGEVLKTGIAVYTDTVKIKYVLSLNFDFLGFGSEIERWDSYHPENVKFPIHELGFSFKTDLTNYKNQYFGFYIGKKLFVGKQK